MLMSSKYLHSLVYIIADAPTADNLSPEVPLVGTKSYKTLLEWLGEMDVDITRVRMYNQSDKPFDNYLSRQSLNQAVQLGQIKVIALGQKAADYLIKTNIDEFFLLPHPSGRNRLINNKKFVTEKLGACKNYIYKGVSSGDKELKKSSTKNHDPKQKSEGGLESDQPSKGN